MEVSMLPRVVLILVVALVLLMPAVHAVGDGWRDDPEIEIESGMVAVAGGKLFYEAAARLDADEVVVLIHDGLLHSVTWEEQIGPMSRLYKVVTYDRRGYGRSSIPQEPYSDLEDLGRVFDKLAIYRAVLIGMSAGGRLAIDFTIAHPERVTALVLVGPVVSGFGYTDHFLSRGGRFGPAVAADPEARRDFWFTTDPYTIFRGNEAARQRARQALAASPHNLDSRHRFLRRPPSAMDRLGTIDIPALIVAGEHDIPDVHAHVGAIDAGLPDSRRVVVADAAHLVPIEQPEEFNRLVLGFLEGRRLLSLIHTGETDAARRELEQILGTHPDLTLFGEQEINRLGYELIANGELDKALAVFELNVLAFPESWNVHDSLGEAFARRGDLEAAAASYSRSVALNPGNDNGVRALETLKQLTAPMPALSGPYLGQNKPGLKLQLFAPEVVSSPAREHSSCTFSRDGRLLIFTRQTPWSHDLYLTEDRGDGWSQPARVPFSSDQLDDGAAFFPGEQRLYFGSRRPHQGAEPGQTDIWFVDLERETGSWGTPQPLGAPINTTTSDGFPSFTDEGTIYFHSDRTGGSGQADIYRARYRDGSFGPVENLGPTINSEGYEGAPFIAPDESYLIFFRNGSDGIELRISWRQGASGQEWTEPISLSQILGLKCTDLVMARVTGDGTYLFILDAGDIHWVDAEILTRIKKDAPP
jgi:pimeloyl-ACP methyl ester carboxylesterase